VKRCYRRAALSAAGDHAAPPPSIDDREGVEALGDVLREANYSAEGFRKLFGGTYAKRQASDLQVHIRRLADGGPLASLVKLLVLGLPITTDEASAAFAPVDLARLEAMNVLRVRDDVVEAQVEIDTLNDVLVASDLPALEAARPDHASPMSSSTVGLAAMTPRGRVERALDVGTGAGLQALLVASHAREVVATDVNPRALAFAEFNAVLNGVGNVEFREGSVFEPVEGETFDLVVSNPPFVIGPAADFLFRDSGLPGDSFVEGLIRSVPRFLNEGGFAVVLLNWIVQRDEPWQAPLQRWVKDSGCDALFVGRATWKPLDYAASANFPLKGDPAAYGAALDRWVEHIEALGLESIAGGLIALRRREGSNWLRAFDAPMGGLDSSAHQIVRLFQAQDYLASTGDDELLETVLAPADDLLVELRPARPRSRLALDPGLGIRVDVDPGTIDLLTRLDGKRRVREAAGDGGIDTVRRLIEFGFVLPADPAAA
jgi:methylase of polypeptide subunit release factors